MQTKFAAYTLYNAEAAQRAQVLVGYFNGRWAVMKIGVRSAEAVNIRDSGTRDERTANLRHAFGTVNNRTKPLIEIGMLLRRHVLLMQRSYYFDDPTDWKVEKLEELSLDQLSKGDYGTSPVWQEALRNIVLRLWVGRDGGTSRVLRIEGLISNRKARLLYNRAPERYTGFLACTPGATWKNSYYLANFQNQEFIARRDRLKQVGAALAECIFYSKVGENFEGSYNELMARVTGNTIMMDLQSPGMIERFHNALMKINNCTVVIGDCAHFEEDHRLTLVGPRNRQQRYCHWCYEHDTVEVADVGNARWPSSMAYWSENHEAYYSYDIDDEENGNDRTRDGHRVILDYSTNVLRVLQADTKLRSSHYGDFLMGWELEMTPGGKDSYTAAKDVRRQLGSDFVVCKHDGSLPTGGFEVVSAPRGLAEHRERIEKWEINPAYRAWDTNQCGLHVHIHSRAFTEMTLGKFIMFFNLDTNASFIRRIAGRHPIKDNWAARFCSQEDQAILESPKKAVKSKYPERYRMINTTNMSRGEAERLGIRTGSSGKYDTVEVRIFKASLRKERLLAQIEFAHASVMFCRVASYRDLTGPSFLKWLAPNSGVYPHLADWFGTRRSKTLKDAKAKTLEEVCPDKVVGDVVAMPARAIPRVARRLPAGINDTVLPVVPQRPRRHEADPFTQPPRGLGETLSQYRVRLDQHNRVWGTSFMA